MKRIAIGKALHQQNQTWRVERDKPPVKLQALANCVGVLLNVKKEGG